MFNSILIAHTNSNIFKNIVKIPEINGGDGLLASYESIQTFSTSLYYSFGISAIGYNWLINDSEGTLLKLDSNLSVISTYSLPIGSGNYSMIELDGFLYIVNTENLLKVDSSGIVSDISISVGNVKSITADSDYIYILSTIGGTGTTQFVITKYNKTLGLVNSYTNSTLYSSINTGFITQRNGTLFIFINEFIYTISTAGYLFLSTYTTNNTLISYGIIYDGVNIIAIKANYAGGITYGSMYVINNIGIMTEINTNGVSYGICFDNNYIYTIGAKDLSDYAYINSYNKSGSLISSNRYLKVNTGFYQNGFFKKI